MAHLTQLIKTGLCQQSAYQLATKLPTLLTEGKQKILFRWSNRCCIFAFWHNVLYCTVSIIREVLFSSYKIMEMYRAMFCHWQEIERKIQDIPTATIVASFEKSIIM